MSRTGLTRLDYPLGRFGVADYDPDEEGSGGGGQPQQCCAQRQQEAEAQAGHQQRFVGLGPRQHAHQPRSQQSAENQCHDAENAQLRHQQARVCQIWPNRWWPDRPGR